MPRRFRPLSSAFSTSASPRPSTSAASSSSQHISEPRRRARLGDIKSAVIARLKDDIDIVLEASVMKEHGRGQAVVSSRQNHDIEDQETGVELALKLPQIVSIANNAKAPRIALFYGFEPPRGTTFLSTLSPGFHQHGSPISAYKFKTPAEVSPSSLCSAIPHHCFFFHTNSSANELRITPPFFQA